MARTFLPAFAGLAMLLLCGVACSGSNTASSSTSSAGGGTAATPTAAPGAAGSASTAAPAAAAASQAVTVNMTDANQFQPTNITIPRGGTVTWVNTGQTTHTVTD